MHQSERVFRAHAKGQQVRRRAGLTGTCCRGAGHDEGRKRVRKGFQSRNSLRPLFASSVWAVLHRSSVRPTSVTSLVRGRVPAPPRPCAAHRAAAPPGLRRGARPACAACRPFALRRRRPPPGSRHRASRVRRLLFAPLFIGYISASVDRRSSIDFLVPSHPFVFTLHVHGPPGSRVQTVRRLTAGRGGPLSLLQVSLFPSLQSLSPVHTCRHGDMVTHPTIGCSIVDARWLILFHIRCIFLLGGLNAGDLASGLLRFTFPHIVALPPDFRSIRLTHRKREFYCVNKTLPVCHGRLETITC